MQKEFCYSYGNYYNNDQFVRMRFDISFNLLSGFIRDGVRIIDIGCYDGAMLGVLKKTAKIIDYVGVDTDSLALKEASNKGAKVIKANFESETLPFEDGSFDIVIIAEVLEHLRDPAKLIEKAKAILKPTGKILISLPNECTLYHRLKMLLGKGIDGTGFSPGYHLHFPTIKQNRDFISAYFRIIKEEYWYHLGVGGLAEKVLHIMPRFVIKSLIHAWPSLFARGVIYLCER